MARGIKDKIRDFIMKSLDSDNRFDKQVSGSEVHYIYEFFWENDGELYSDTVYKLCSSNNPRDALHLYLCSIYEDEEFRILDELKKSFRSRVVNRLKRVKYSFDITVVSEVVDSILDNLILFNYPIEDYLNQAVRVSITVDTGDANTEYSLNNLELADSLDERASIVWLAQVQGYLKTPLKKCLKSQVFGNSPFLKSLYNELYNLTYSVGELTFLVKMKLSELMDISVAINYRDKGGYHYNPKERESCGWITLSKGTQAGLLDSINGAGGLFEIKLEKDFNLPIRYIGGIVVGDKAPSRYTYTYSQIFSANRSDWKETLLGIHIKKSIIKH